MTPYPETPVPASFSRASRTYRHNSKVQDAMADWLGHWVPEQRHGRALELGAGPGVFTRQLLPWTGELTASDLAEGMCAAGRESLPDVDWRIMCAETPQSVPCDWIFTCSMLQWIENPRVAFAAWNRILKSGGRVLAGLFTEGSLPELRELTHGWTPLTWRTSTEWAECLHQGGLRLLREETETRVFHHPTALDLFRSLHGVGAAPFHQFTPGRLRRIIRDYDMRHRNEHGVRSTWVFHRFEAIKAE
ncbi:MAG: methyltransferase domain-containing protein [Opitutaceae bacterium]|jgi:SAM-dependent methyltransferase